MKNLNAKPPEISACQEAFNSGQAWRRAQRQSHPMSFSRYKIVETLENWSGYPTELRNIGFCASGVSAACFSLRHCVREDKSKWLKKLPESMLEDFARNVAEVLYALQGDGVPHSAIDDLEEMLRAEVPRLISLGEDARLEAKHDWRRLTKSLASGKWCVVTEFVDAIQSLVANVVEQISTSMPQGCDEPSRQPETTWWG
jgi:hypothetical protein